MRTAKISLRSRALTVFPRASRFLEEYTLRVAPVKDFQRTRSLRTNATQNRSQYPEGMSAVKRRDKTVYTVGAGRGHRWNTQVTGPARRASSREISMSFCFSYYRVDTADAGAGGFFFEDFEVTKGTGALYMRSSANFLREITD